ncbi:cupin domain-containing protein [Geothrix sp. 21YS21S-4]|uniref:cupin domain-containing protein n=1 Tax=Geothrix sp. 21YS21S-4 TaxID=3068889 RepID=UPI0027B92205|nr:cupin domain-containing protein [Geothrix sp. 21YS21S-4]
MTSPLMPTCERVITLFTDYEDGALGPIDWFGLKLHLSVCPPCRAFLESLRRTAPLLRSLTSSVASPAPAERALSGALAALREGRVPQGPQHHPEPALWEALEPGGDPFTALMLRVHLGHCAGCRATYGPDQAIPAAPDAVATLKPLLPPEETWRWARRGLGGMEVAHLARNKANGASFSLAKLNGGRTIPFHRHAGTESSLILCGSLHDGPAHLRAGDWITHGPDCQHSPTAGPEGECWALIRIEGGIHFSGWRSLMGAIG